MGIKKLLFLLDYIYKFDPERAQATPPATPPAEIIPEKKITTPATDTKTPNAAENA